MKQTGKKNNFKYGIIMFNVALKIVIWYSILPTRQLSILPIRKEGKTAFGLATPSYGILLDCVLLLSCISLYYYIPITKWCSTSTKAACISFYLETDFVAKLLMMMLMLHSLPENPNEWSVRLNYKCTTAMSSQNVPLSLDFSTQRR